mmetsp:Transcript_1945/g.2453  ORF Transcript_1945/g.2453 Transcript_1945/m.2453 type:complete len:137 (+) Transcript_1945:1066-1476(+)
MQSTKSNQHIPFRTSKLTMILKDSFVSSKSNVRVHMIACVSPCHSSVDHSLNTLRYADKLKTKIPPKSGGSPTNEKKCSKTFILSTNVNTDKTFTIGEDEVKRVHAALDSLNFWMSMANNFPPQNAKPRQSKQLLG